MKRCIPPSTTLTHLRRGLRFAGVGVINTAVYYISYLILRSQFTYLIAHVVAFATAMIVSYFLNCLVTFRTAPRWRTFLLFPLANVANFMIITVGIQVAVRECGIDQRIAPLLAALVALPITYLVTHAVMAERNRRLGCEGSGTAVSGTSDAGARPTAGPRK